MASYARKSIEFSYLRTKDDAEIDLIIERPGMPTIIAAIKSATLEADKDVTKLARFLPDFPNSEAIIICDESVNRTLSGVDVLPWREALKRIIYG